MLRRLDSAVPKGTNVVILQPGSNDLRFFGARNVAPPIFPAIVNKLRARGIRVIVYDPKEFPADFYQWDGIHFNAAAHAKIAATLASQFTGAVTARSRP